MSNCAKCGACQSCGSRVVWTGLTPIGNANAAAMNHQYHVIDAANAAVQAPSVHLNWDVAAAAVVAPLVVVIPPDPCDACGR